MTLVQEAFGISKPAVKSFKPSDQFKLVNPALIIGMELETENLQMGTYEYEVIGKNTNFSVTQDGSLRGNAFEFISKPMRSDAALGALNSFFTQTKFDERNYTDRCSVHVHVNCVDLSLDNVAALAVLYTVVEEILFSYVGGNRDSNIYCIPWSQCRSHLDLVQRFLADPSTVLRKWNKYTALNLLPLAKQGTVEFRQMHGTANMEKLSTWINIIGSLFKNATEYKLNDLITEIKTLNSTSQYEMFYNKILSGILPYNELYRQKMEEGVIFAKYSLISMSKNKDKPVMKKVVEDEILEDLLGEMPVPEAAPQELRVPRAVLGDGGWINALRPAPARVNVDNRPMFVRNAAAQADAAAQVDRAIITGRLQAEVARLQQRVARGIVQPVVDNTEGSF